MKNLIYFLIIFLFAFSCKKMENVKKEAPEMIGYWSHLSENNGFHYIYIQNNGRGYLYGQNNHGNNQDTQRRGWYIDNDVLYFSRFQNNVSEDMFTIDAYPSVATTIIPDAYNTINQGDTYMILNGRNYKKTN